MYNIAKDLGEVEDNLPDTMTTAQFDRLMARSFDNTPTRSRNQNSYIRDQVVLKYYAPQV